MKTVIDLIREGLEREGFDGLSHEDEPCSCGLNEIGDCPPNCSFDKCKPAKLQRCDICKHRHDDIMCEIAFEDRRKKPFNKVEGCYFVAGEK